MPNQEKLRLHKRHKYKMNAVVRRTVPPGCTERNAELEKKKKVRKSAVIII